MIDSPGPAAQLIDFGYAVKLPLCREVDKAFGFQDTGLGPLSAFLQICYAMRRPGFVAADMCSGWHFWK